MSEYPACDLRIGVEELATALRLEPRFHPAWLVLGAAALFMGRYDAAIEILTHAERLEREPDLLYRFVGARTLRGMRSSARVVRIGHRMN